MAGPTIKEYVIKITAEAKKAQQEIDQLAESFSKVGISGKFNLDLEKQTEAINGSIGKVTELLVALKQQFKDGIDTRNLSDDIKNLSKELTEAVNSMKTSFDGFAKTYEGLSLTPNGDIGAKMDAFVSSMGDFIEKYNGLFGKLELTKDAVDITPNIGVIADAIKTQGQSIDEAKKQLEDDKNKLLEALEAQEEINKIVKRFNRNRANITNASLSGVRKTRTGERLMTTKELENAEDIVREAIRVSNKYKSKKIDGINVQELLFDKIDTTPKGLERSLEGIVDNIDRAIDLTKERVVDRVKSDGEVTDVLFKISLHPDAISEETINSLVNQIRTLVIDKIQKRINDSYIKIPIGLTSESGLEEKTLDMLEAAADDKHLSGIRKSLYVDVKANVKGLAEQIDTEIKNLNKSITLTIDVKIRPVVPNSYALSDAIAETSERLGNTASDDGYVEGMIPIDISKLNIQSNTFDEQSFGELTNIRDLVSRILSILSGRNPNTPPPPAPIPVQPTIAPPSGGNGAVNARTTTPQATLPPSAPAISLPNKVVKNDTVRTQLVENLNINNVVVTNQKNQNVQQQETKSPSPEDLLGTPRRLYNFDRFVWATMRGRNINEIRGNTTNLNWATSANRDAEKLYKEGIHAFLNDLKNPNRTLADMQSKNYYATSYDSQNLKMAYFGRPGQTLQSLQSELTEVFTTTNKKVVDAVNEIKQGYEADRTSTELVDSGINGNKVTKWMKRIIDDDKYLEEQDLKGKRFTNKKKEINEKHPNWASNERNRLIQDVNQNLVNLEGVYDSNQKEIASLEAEKKAYLKIINESENGLKQREQYVKDLRAGKYSNIDGFDELLETINALLELDRYNKQHKSVKDKNTEIISDLDKLSTELQKENEKRGKEVAATRSEVFKIQNMSDDELLKQRIREEHKQRRNVLSEYVGGITKEFDEILNKAQKREVSKKADEIANGAIVEKFGASALKTLKNGNVSLIDVKNERALARIRDLERNGLVVDERTSNIISFKTPEVSREWSYEDLVLRLDTVSKIAQEKLQEQMAITELLSEGEGDLNRYAEAYEKHLSGNATQEDRDVIATLREQVALRAYYFTSGEEIDRINEENEKLFDKIKSGKASKADKQKYEENTKILNKYQLMNELQVYEMAQRQLQMIKESKDQEKYIIGHYKDILSDMADKDSARRINKATYEKIKARYKEQGKIMDKYQSRVRVTDTGVDTSQLTPYESDEYWKAYDARNAMRRKILGYEYAKGIRDFSGRTANESQGQLSVGNMVVSNLGLSQETGKAYAKLPAIKSISELYRDNLGRIQYDQFGSPMLSNTNNMTSDQLESNAELLTSVVKEISNKLDTLPSDEDLIRQIATERVDADVKEMLDRLASINKDIEERNAFNEKYEQEIKAGTISPKAIDAHYEKEKAKLEESIESLSTDSKGTKRVEEIRKDREELAKLQEEEKMLINQYQEETGISNDVVQKIEALVEARKTRKEYEEEYKDLRDVVGYTEKKRNKKTGEEETVEHLGLKVNKPEHMYWTDDMTSTMQGTLKMTNPQNGETVIKQLGVNNALYKDTIVNAVNSVLKGVFGDNALKSFNYKAVTGYDYSSVEEIVLHVDDLESLLRMYDDIVEEAEKELKKVLPKNKANKLLKEATRMEEDEYGGKRAKAESGRIMDKLVENRNKQEELAGEIRKNEYDMQRDGEEEQSLRKTRIKNYSKLIEDGRKELTRIMETAKKDSASYRQMASLQREREEDKKRIDELKAKVDPLATMPVEKRAEEIEAESQRTKAEIDEELRKENEKLLEQRNVIIETYNLSARDLQQKQQELAMANSALDKVKGKDTLTIPSAEEVYMGNLEYASLSNLIKDLEGARRSEKSIENRKLINQQLMGLKSQENQLKNNIQSSQVETVEELIFGLLEAVEQNLPTDLIRQIGKNLLGEYSKYLALPIASGKDKIDLSHYDTINGQSPIDYANELVSGVSKQEIADKEKVVLVAQQELELARQRYSIAQRGYNEITEGTLSSSGEITLIEAEIKSTIMSLLEAANEKVAAHKKLDIVEATRNRKENVDINYYNSVKDAAAKADVQYNKIGDTLISLYDRLRPRNEAHLAQNPDDAMVEYDSIRSNIMRLYSKINDLETTKVLELEALSKGLDEYQSYLYDRYGLPKPLKVVTGRLKDIDYYQSGTEEKRKAAVQERAFIRQANLDRYAYGNGSTEIGKMETIKASRKAKRQEKREALLQKRSENMFDSYYFADMTTDQAVVSKKILRLATQKNKRYGLSRDGEAELLRLQKIASDLGLEILDNGYVKPLISKDEFKNNKDAHNVPQLSQQELILQGLMSAREQYSEWAKHNEDLRQELDKTSLMAEQYFGESEAFVPSEESWDALSQYLRPDDELEDVGKAINKLQNDLIASTKKLVATLNPGEYKLELNELYKSLLPSLGNGMSPEDIFKAILGKLSELLTAKAKPTQLKQTQLVPVQTQQARQGLNVSTEAELLFKKFKDAVATKKIDSGEYQDQVKKEYLRLGQLVLQKKIMPEYAASVLKTFTDNLIKTNRNQPPKSGEAVQDTATKVEETQRAAGQAILETTEKLREQQKAAQEAPTTNALTYNGKQYQYLADDKRKEISGRVKSSEALAPLMGIKKDAKRNDIKSINAVKEALNAYVLTGENEIIEELKRSISNGKNKNLGRGLKAGVKSFINSELGLPTLDIKDKATALQSMKDVFAQYGKEGLVSALKDLTQRLMIKIAEDNGYPKDNKLKNQSKDSIANLIAGKFELSFGATIKANEAVRDMTQASSQANTAGLELVKEKADEVTESATHATEAVSAVKQEAETPSVDQSPTLPVYGANGRVLGKAKRNNTPYSQEEFAANPGLAEKVLAANGAIYNTDYWVQSRANALAYLDTLKEVKQTQDDVTRDINGINKQIPGLIPEQQIEYEELANEVLARGQDDIRVGAMTSDDVEQELSELEARYVAIGLAAIEAANGISKVNQELDNISIHKPNQPLALTDQSVPAEQTAQVASETTEAATQAEALAQNLNHASAEATEVATKMQETATATEAAVQVAAQVPEVQAPTKEADTVIQPKLEAKTATAPLPPSNTSQQNVLSEATAFAQMGSDVNTLNGYITTKNELLSTELATIQEELKVVSELVSKMLALKDAAGNVNINLDFSKTDGLNAEFITQFSNLAKEILLIDVLKFDSVGKVLDGLHIGKNVGKNFKALGEDIKSFVEAASQGLTGNNNFLDLMSLIDRISASGEYISKMSDVLKNSAKAGQGAFGYKYSQDSQIEELMKEYVTLMNLISNPSSITKYKYLLRQEQLYQENKGSGILTKDIAWYTDFSAKLKQAYELHDVLSEVGVLEDKARKTLNDKWKNLNDMLSEISNSLNNEAKLLDALAKERVTRIEEQFGSGKYNGQYDKGIDVLKGKLDSLHDSMEKGKISVEDYKKSIDEAFSDFTKFLKINNTAFGNLASTKLMDTPEGYTQENARQFVEEYIKNNYKNVISDVSETTKVVDGSQVSVFTARVQDALGVVLNLRMAWSDVSNEIRIASSEVSKGKTGIDNVISAVTGKLKNLYAYWGALLFNPYRLIGYAKQLMNVVKTYDSALMEMRKVSSESTETLREFQDASFGVANQVGTTAATIQSSAASWMRLGKSLSESAEAAKASAWLVNVSEFTSIDDATSSLISLRQAFQDLSYEDFIDKLNGVGDSFSSSTTDLAKGMQNVAAVLKTNGNDLDQSLALLTAANDITQDISKASMGVRTIALRISGTEDAKAELEELGEDTSDFIVLTQSKVDAKVRKYTATAENPNGISVLDENGRLRDTYDILLDISKVYDLIVEKDNEFGTNTSNALLELLAGKTRSNVLASIFQNPELLESAYETSKNSKGVGQKELDVYLDSIEARLSKARNLLESILTNLVESDSVKLILDLFNQILSVINKVTESFGGLNTAVSLFISTFMRMKGFSLFPTKNGDGFLSSLFGIGSKAQIAKLLNPLQQLMKNIFSNIKYDDADDFFEVMGKNGFTLKDISSSEAFQPLLNSIDHTTDASLTMGQAVQIVNSQLGATSGLAAGATGMLSKLATGAFGVVKSFASIGLSTLAFAAVTKAIGFAIEKIHELATANERAIEVGKKAREEAESLAKEYANTEKQTNELGKKYNKLREGVTYTEGKGYTNNKLSDSEFEEFLLVNKDLIALYPQLKAGTDSQGNAYVNLGNNASKATEELEKYLAILERITNKKIGDTFDTLLAGVLADNATFAHNIDDANYDLTTLDLYKNGINKYVQETGERSRKIVLEQLGGVNEEILALIEEALGDNLTEETRQWGESIDNSLDAQRLETIEISFDINPEEEDVAKKIDEIIYGVDRKLAETASDIEGTVYESNRRIKDNYESLRPAMIGAIKGTRTYQNMSDEIQKGIDEIYSNIDIYDAYNIFENMPDDEKKAKNINTFIDYLEDQYLYAIDSAINNAGDDIDPQELAEKLNLLFSFDASNLNSMLAVNQIDAILSSIFGDDTELKQSIKVGLGIEYIDPDTGKPINKFVKQNHDLYDVLKDYGLSLSDISSGLTIGEKDKIQDSVSSGTFNFLGGGLDKLKEWLKKEYLPELDGSLSDIFNDASYKENTEEISSNISTISSSLETLRNNGKLTAEEMMKLQESFPDMTEFTEEALSSRGVELLSKWIKELRKDYDTLSNEGKELVDTYANNLMSSFGDVIATENEARTAIYGALFDSHATDTLKLALAEQIEETIKALQDKYGEELDWNIVWQLAVNDLLSGEMDDIYNRYDERVLNWDINVNIPKEVEQLERNIAGRNARISAIEAEKGYYDATGEYLPDINENWFDEMLRLSGQNVADKTVEYTNAQKTYAAYTNGLFGKMLSNASPELSSGAYKAMAEARAAMVLAMTEQTDIQKLYYEFLANMYTKEIEEAQTNAAKVLARIDLAKFEGVMPAETDYAELRDAYKMLAEMQEGLANFWDTVANSDEVNPVMRAIANQNAATARANVISANESANEADRGYLTDELLEKQNTYNDLKTEASQIEQQITDDETKHRKISNKRYDELIKNGDKLLANLEDLRETLVELSDKTIQGTDKWREYQSQIDDVDSSISNMLNSQVGWFESMTTAVSSNALTLASALDSAFSEINSETGLTRDTMNTLVEQFSDLENYDVSKIFYSTADGMKFNTDATRELIDAEYDLLVNNLRDSIAEETAIIEANKDSKDANSYATIQNAQANINAYNAELASLQALYDQQLESLSRYSAWETAKSTANAGDKYTNLLGSWKDIKEMFQNGLTGTDDFKSFVAYFDEWGMGTVDAYKRNKDMIARYLTEDGKGMKNFYDDLVSKGFGTKTGNIYSIGIEDTEAAAHAMGMSEEALKMFLDRGEDYGFRNTWVETVLDGELKLLDTTEQLIEEQERLQHMRANGATEDEIKNQETLVSQLKDNMKNYIENTADVAGEDNTKTYAKTIEQLKAINELRGETFGAKVKMTDREFSAYNQQLDNAMQQTLGGYTSDLLQEFKIKYEAELDDDSKRIIDLMTELAKLRELIQKYTAEVEIKDESGQPITPEEFLSLTEEQQKETLEATYGVTIDETNFDLWKEHFQSQTLTAKVQTVVDSGTTSYKDLLNMDAEELTQTIGFNVDESNIDEVKAKIEEMSAVKVSLDEASLTSLTSVLSEAFVLAINTILAGELVDEFVEETDDKTGTVQVDADTKEGEGIVARFINSIMSKHPEIRILADPTILTDSIQEILNNREFNVNVKANVNAPAAVVKPGVAKKAGNVAVNGRNNGHAYANGKPGDLVGELGREIVVDPHTGRYYTVGDNGPEFTNIPDDAIVFNADLTDDLLKHGHTSTRGRALVTGNAFDSADSANEFVYNDPKNTFGNGAKATKDNTKATKDNTKASKEQKTALDKFNEWLGKWVDWIDNRIDSLSNRIERFEKKADELIDYSKKNQKIQKAMDTLSTILQYQNALLKTKKVKGTNGVITEVATGTKGVKKGTLLGDTMRGAVRYQQQADKVMKKAVKSGLLSLKKANEIAKLILTGEIDIRKYNEKVRAVILAYEDWFGKSQDLIDSTYELKQQFKDLEQTKLDNITERFETLVGLFEAANTLSEAAVDYYSERGSAVNTVDKTEMGFQLERQGRITQELENERTAYETEMKQAKTIFGESSNEYRLARTLFYQIQEELKKSLTSELSLKHAIEELTFTVRGFVIDRIQSFVSKLGNIASLAEKRGTNKALGYEVTEDVFSEQIGYNNDLILKYAEDLQARKDEIARRTIEEGLEINSDAYLELYNKIVADEDAMYKLYSANEDLKMSIRNLRWKPFKEFLETLDKIESDFNHILSFIREGELLDEDGQFTARGFTQIALIGENMDVAEKKIANARAAIEKLNDELEVGTINEETFGEEFEQQMKIIQDSASDAYDEMQKLADMYIKLVTEENSILQDLIKSRQDALSKKKAYYDYDKQIREKNKDVNSLRAQVQALQNVSTDAAKARRALLQAQLAEAELDLNDTRYDHLVEMQQQGYEQLSEDMQKALDDAVKLINGDQKVLQDTAASMLAQLETNHIDEKAVIADIVNGTGTKIHDETLAMINETLTATTVLSEEAQGIANAVSAIATLLGQNPANTAKALSSILMELGSNGTLSLAIKKFANANGIKINETGLDGVITAIAAPYDKKGLAARLFNEIKGVIKGDSDSLYNSLFNKSNGLAGTISAISRVLGTELDSTFTRMLQLLDNLGATGTLSQAITEFINEQGNGINDETQALINKMTAPYDQGGQANTLMNEIKNALTGTNGALKLLSDLKVEKKLDADGTPTYTFDVPQAITKQLVSDSVSAINTTVETKLDSIGKNVSKHLKAIEDAYLKLTSNLGTTGESAKGTENVVRDDDLVMKDAKDEAKPTTTKPSDSEAKPTTTKPSDSEAKTTVVSAVEKLSSSTSTSDVRDAVANVSKNNKLADDILAAIALGEKHPKKITQDEKDNHAAIWEYLVTNYGRTGNNKVYTALAKALGIKVSSEVTGEEKKEILKKLKAKGYASGTKRVGKNMDAWTNEDWENLGAEMIVRKSDGAILTPLKANDSVIPANLADNLFKWGAISPDKFLSNPFMGKMGDLPSNANVTNQVDQKVEMHFDSLFTIQGDVNADVMDRLEEFGKALTSDRNFQLNVVKFVTKDFVRESKKQGGFR